MRSFKQMAGLKRFQAPFAIGQASFHTLSPPLAQPVMLTAVTAFFFQCNLICRDSIHCYNYYHFVYLCQSVH